jgi:hypothetical protein
MNWKKQLKELELELDGCKCYHEATEAFIEDIIEEVIEYISLNQGWEETGDIYREHYNLPKKYEISRK